MSAVICGTAGDIGFSFNVFLSGYNATGATATLEASPIVNGCATPISVGPAPMTISSDGSTATYVWTGSDFMIGGLWNTWTKVVMPSGDSFTVAGTIFVQYPPP
jgi:hypothetical protein